MLNFFRRIRRKLANENRFLQYSRYAIGEIVLVMVGILLALQVNNWNELRKQSLLVKNSLESLKEDLRIQQEIIDEQISNESGMVAIVDSITKLIDDPVEIKIVDRLMDTLTSRLTFVAVKATFNNLESTGGLFFLKDMQLQNSIVRYYQNLDYTTAVINNNNLFIIDNQYSQFYLENPLQFSMNKIGLLSKKNLLNDEERYRLLINLKRRMTASKSIGDKSSELKEMTNDLIVQVENALNNSD